MIQSYYVDKYRALIDKIEQIESSNKNKIRLVVVSKNQDSEKIVTLRKLGQKTLVKTMLMKLTRR